MLNSRNLDNQLIIHCFILNPSENHTIGYGLYRFFSKGANLPQFPEDTYRAGFAISPQFCLGCKSFDIGGSGFTHTCTKCCMEFIRLDKRTQQMRKFRSHGSTRILEGRDSTQIRELWQDLIKIIAYRNQKDG